MMSEFWSISDIVCWMLFSVYADKDLERISLSCVCDQCLAGSDERRPWFLARVVGSQFTIRSLDIFSCKNGFEIEPHHDHIFERV